VIASSSTGFTYDWQQQPDNFLKWLLPTLISAGDREMFECLSEATDKFTNVTLTIQVNGVNVPVENFLSGVESNMTYYANKEAARLVTSIPRLERLREAMDDADHALRERLVQIMAEAGVDLGDTDD
jgi:hypothetical protein